MPLMRRTRGVITPAVLEEPQFRTYKLGWVPVNYDLGMQQVVHAAYEKNQGCHHARGP